MTRFGTNQRLKCCTTFDRELVDQPPVAGWAPSLLLLIGLEFGLVVWTVPSVDHYGTSVGI